MDRHEHHDRLGGRTEEDRMASMDEEELREDGHHHQHSHTTPANIQPTVEGSTPAASWRPGEVPRKANLSGVHEARGERRTSRNISFEPSEQLMAFIDAQREQEGMRRAGGGPPSEHSSSNVSAEGWDGMPPPAPAPVAVGKGEFVTPAQQQQQWMSSYQRLQTKANTALADAPPSTPEPQVAPRGRRPSLGQLF